MIAIAAIAWVAGFGLAAAWTAARVDRLAPYWLVLGAALGPVALLLLRVAPPGRCRSCGTTTRGWLRFCWWCRKDVTSVPGVTSAMLARLQELRGGDEATALVPEPLVQVVVAKGSSEPLRPAPSPARRPTPGPVTAARATPADRALAWPTANLVRAMTSRARRTTPPTATVPAVSVATQVVATTPTVSGERVKSRAERRILASAVNVAGSGRLEPGRRYGLAIEGDRFLLLGPTDADPTAVVLARPASGIALHEIGGRLIISEPRSRSSLVLAFMSLAGRTVELQAMIKDEPPGSTD